MIRRLVLFYTLIILSGCQSAQYRSTLQQQELYDLIDQARKRYSDALVIYHGNKQVAQWYSAGSAQRMHTMSITKSIVGLLFACMQTQGLIDSFDMPISKFYSQWSSGCKSTITLRHIMSHTSGLQDRTPNDIHTTDDVIKQTLNLKHVYEPGVRFVYANSPVNILAGIAQKITGMPLDQYAQKVLFGPLGMSDVFWEKDQEGTPFCFAGLHMFPDDLAKIGLLVLHDGHVNNKLIIAPEFLKVLLSPSQTINPTYGLLWWLMTERDLGISGRDNVISYRASGYLGQELVIYFDKKLVGVRMHQRDMHDMKREEQATMQGNEFMLFHPQLNPVYFWDFQKLLYDVVT